MDFGFSADSAIGHLVFGIKTGFDSYPGAERFKRFDCADIAGALFCLIAQILIRQFLQCVGMPGMVGHQLNVTTNQFFIGWRYCTAGRLPVIKSQIQEGKNLR
jgi:hypothetical protein